MATLAFSLSDDSLRLTVQDEGGWLASASELDPDPVLTVLADAGFDQVIATVVSQFHSVDSLLGMRPLDNDAAGESTETG